MEWVEERGRCESSRVEEQLFFIFTRYIRKAAEARRELRTPSCNLGRTLYISLYKTNSSPLLLYHTFRYAQAVMPPVSIGPPAAAAVVPEKP